MSIRELDPKIRVSIRELDPKIRVSIRELDPKIRGTNCIVLITNKLAPYFFLRTPVALLRKI
ncbi:hypothetical protein KCTCHS21_60450 [Cohnella abietis]|uniref:Uncharacterized protein n=1 Tax=Cohnella abietis TaxID=2507935 RepID=A0A3T1DER0_9BACL|nr:hypothetical protein KCTCHS21_60450 [Cohnella abietis]